MAEVRASGPGSWFGLVVRQPAVSPGWGGPRVLVCGDPQVVRVSCNWVTLSVPVLCNIHAYAPYALSTKKWPQILGTTRSGPPAPRFVHVVQLIVTAGAAAGRRGAAAVTGGGGARAQATRPLLQAKAVKLLADTEQYVDLTTTPCNIHY